MCLPDKQKAELDELVKDPKSRIIIIKLMGIVLLGFLALTKYQMRLFIKFLIESVDELEKEEKDPRKFIENYSDYLT